MAPYHVRRTDREITDAAELDSLLREGKFVTIAFARADEPYLVTLSYGFDAERRALYFHTATEGLKYEFAEANPRVCATVVLDGGYVPGECEHNYRSLVLRGTFARVTDPAELRHGMRVLLGHLEGDAEEWMAARKLDHDEAYRKMAVARLDIESVTGKQGK